jgi:hypothetical protein
MPLPTPLPANALILAPFSALAICMSLEGVLQRRRGDKNEFHMHCKDILYDIKNAFKFAERSVMKCQDIELGDFDSSSYPTDIPLNRRVKLSD